MKEFMLLVNGILTVLSVVTMFVIIYSYLERGEDTFGYFLISISLGIYFVLNMCAIFED